MLKKEANTAKLISTLQKGREKKGSEFEEFCRQVRRRGMQKAEVTGNERKDSKTKENGDETLKKGEKS